MSFEGFVRANTQVIVTIGPFPDVGDGFTPQTDITLGGNEAELLKHGSTTVVDISVAIWAAVANCRGYYSLTLTTSHTDTEGMMTVVVQDDSDCLPVRNSFMVMSEAAWDSLYVAKDAGFMDVNIKTVGRADAQETEANNLESACSNYSATRGLTGTAVPAAVADAAGGLPISDDGGLDMDSILEKMLAYFQLLVRSDAAIATDNATELTAINADGGSGAGDFSNQTEANEALRDHIGNGANLTEAGGDGDHLTAINLPNQTMDITGNITGNLSGSVGSLTTNNDKTGYTLSAAGNTAVIDEFETQAAVDPTGFKVNTMEVNGTAQTANDNGADINAILVDTARLYDSSGAGDGDSPVAGSLAESIRWLRHFAKGEWRLDEVANPDTLKIYKDDGNTESFGFTIYAAASVNYRDPA